MPSNKEIWEETHSTRGWSRYPNEELVRFIGSNFFRIPREDRKKIRILELGIGQGANVWFLLRENFDVYGIDISKSAIKKTFKRLKDENLFNVELEKHLKVGDIRKLPFDNENFDVVIDIATTWYVSYTEHNKAYKEILRILKKNGLFFTWHVLKDSWGDDGINYIDKDTKKNVTEGPLSNTGIQYFAKYEDLIDLLESNGLKIIEKETLERSYENMQKSLKYAIIIAKN